MQKAHAHRSNTIITYFCPSVWIHQVPFGPLYIHAFGYQYINPETMNLASFSDNIHLTYMSKLTSWMLCIIGLLHENIQYGIPQSQHYTFGWQTSNHTSSVMPQNECTQLSSTATQHSNYGTHQKKYSSVTS